MKIKNHSTNAIIIIGNGFDLAHQFPTSYNDFANWYIKNKIFKALKEENHSIISEYFLKTLSYHSSTYERFNDEFRALLYKLKPTYNHNYEESACRYLEENTNLIEHIITNNFLSKLYSNSYTNWFDIEKAYFTELKEKLKEYSNNKNISRAEIIEDVDILNKELNHIKASLKEYLKTIEINLSEDVSSFFQKNFHGKKNIYVVNFNYTKTFQLYNKHIVGYDKKATQPILNINHIHGDLENEIIFGYGDDKNEEYLEMKNLEIDEFLENLKTYYYYEKSNYREILNTIESFKDYEVYVLGHSLGLTDKTLLSEILEPKKCLNIHLYKRMDITDEFENKQEFKKLHYSLSRIISDDNDSRRKVVPMVISTHFPYLSEDSKILHEKYTFLYGKGYDDVGKSVLAPRIKATNISL